MEQSVGASVESLSVTKVGSVFSALTSAEFLRFDLARGLSYHLGGLGGGWRPPPNDE